MTAARSPQPEGRALVSAHLARCRPEGALVARRCVRDGDERLAVIRRASERHHRKIKRLQDDQARLVQLAIRGLAKDEVLAREQQRLEDEQRAHQLLEAAKLHTEDIDQRLDDALAKTETPHASYMASPPLERRLLNQAFLKRILIGEDGEVLGTTLTPGLRSVERMAPASGPITPQEGLSGRPGASRSKPRSPLWGPGFALGSNGGARGTRTPDLLGAIQALSQLSYSPAGAAQGQA
jgi:hypothetical protein